LARFVGLLKDFGVSVADYTEEMLEDDLAFAKSLC